MRRIIITTVSALALIIGASVHVLAEPSAEDAFEYRHSLMTALKGHAGAISMQTRGLAGDANYVSNHASAVAALVSELKTVFQEGSITEDSEALPAIWEKPEKFAEALAKAEEAAVALGEVAAGGDIQAIDGAFRELGGACKGCHDDFRKEHEEEH